MPPTKVDICNMALTHIGIKQTIANITDANEEAAMCNLHYDNALESALHEADWGFARRRAQLLEHSGDPPEPWAYWYVYPTNCVRIVKLDNKRQKPRPEERWEFRVFNDGATKVVLTQIEPSLAYAIYTFLELDDQRYTPPFAFYLSHLLAARICAPLTGDEDMALKQERRAMVELERAVAKDFEGEEEGVEVQASWIDAREADVGRIPGIRADEYWSS